MRKCNMSKIFTVRLSDEQVAELTKLSTFDGVAIAEEIRDAISMLLTSKPRNPEFIRRVREFHENAGAYLADLEGGRDMITALGKPPDLPKATRAAAAAAADGTPRTLKAAAARKLSASAARARSHR
jgi:hypothetical protein